MNCATALRTARDLMQADRPYNGDLPLPEVAGQLARHYANACNCRQQPEGKQQP